MTAPVALFDVDGTLVRRDSTRTQAAELARWQTRRALRAVRHAWRLKLSRSASSIQSAKCALLGALVRGRSRAQIDAAVDRAAEIVRKDRRPEVVQAILEWANNGGRAIVVSASPGFFLRSALRDLPVEVIATEFEVVGDHYNGMLASPVCFGDAKVAALASLLGPEARIEQAWSDSLHDLPMMRCAGRRIWLCPPADPVAVRRADPEGIVMAPRSVAL